MKTNLCVISVVVTILSACGGPRAMPDRSGAVAGALDAVQAALSAAPASAETEASPPLIDGSLYDLGAVLRDQEGRNVSLDVFKGHPVLVTMFYASCTNACPLLMSDLKRLERQLPPAVRDRARVLMISFDPGRDTPDALARQARERGLDVTRWKLASAADDTAREISAALGIRYRKLDSGVYFHTSAIVLLDEQGRPKARIDGLGRDPTSLVLAMR